MTSQSFFVRVPASSANLGPGFDALGMALSVHLEMGPVIDGQVPSDAKMIDEFHPGHIAFRSYGGIGDVWVRSKIPMGRGLGFSGASRVAGVVVAHAQKNGASVEALVAARNDLLHASTQLEGHPDNVAASLVGGVTASASGEVVRIPLAVDPTILAWVPETKTSTEKSRTALATTLSLGDAVFNIGHTALLMGALASGDIKVLRKATQDRIHQDIRLANAPGSKAALEAALLTNAWCAWLSGSGPTVAVMCAKSDAKQIATQLPQSGEVLELTIDQHGAVIVVGE
jgi:homoserine kinase